MEIVHKLEKSLQDLFKDLPPLPPNGKKKLVEFWPWLALIAGVLQIVAAWGLWTLVHTTQPFIDFANELFRSYDVGYSALDKFVIYVGIGTLLVEGVILIMAFSPLQKHLKRGWDLLFLGLLINVAYAVLSIFMVNGGFGNFVMNLIGSGLGMYLLFQIRDVYQAKTGPTEHPAS